MDLHRSDEHELAGLLRAAVAGDEKAYGDFLRRAARVVGRLVRRRSAQYGVDLEDVVQETLLAIHVKRHTWRVEAPLRPWINAIARSKLVDAFRRRGRHFAIEIEHVAETLAAPETGDPISDREIGRVLDALTPGQRSIVAAVSVDGRSIRETAENLGMSETAVRVALHRGLRSIARRFAWN
jgi:RNA polymerase sigma-70 factor, ECF subfamily